MRKHRKPAARKVLGAAVFAETIAVVLEVLAVQNGLPESLAALGLSAVTLTVIIASDYFMGGEDDE